MLFLRNIMFSARQVINYIISRYKHQNIYKLCAKLWDNDKFPNYHKGNILITPITGPVNLHIFEGLFSRKAILNGEKVYGLICGGYLHQCEGINAHMNYKTVRCAYCLSMQEDLINCMGIIPCSYHSEITQEDEKNISFLCDNFFATMDERHYYLNVNIDELLYTALQRYYLVADPLIRNDTTTRGFLHTIITTLIVMERLCKKIKPKYVLSSHGTYSTWGAVVEYCKANNIYVVTWGRTYNKNGITFAYDNSYLKHDVLDTSNKWLTSAWDAQKRDRAIRFLEERMGRINDKDVAYDYNKGNKHRYTKDEICTMLGLSKDTKIVCLLPNIPWDGQVTGQSGVFPKFKDWLETTVTFFSQHKNIVLIVRSHPAEVLIGDTVGRETVTTMLSELYPDGLPSNIIVLPPQHTINSYTLGENSIFGITYSSTITLELLHMRIPVILCGCPDFKGKNIAFDINSQEDYIALLLNGLQQKLSVDDERLERLYRFVHYFFFERVMPERLLKLNRNGVENVTFSSDTELNAEPAFDEMYHCVENKEEMDFSHFYA